VEKRVGESVADLSTLIRYELEWRHHENLLVQMCEFAARVKTGPSTPHTRDFVADARDIAAAIEAFPYAPWWRE
jgi:hypothetical protein